MKEPDLVEVSALAIFLHSFYNGVEKIFVTIAKEIDIKTPNGTQWHRDIVNQMAEDTDKRNKVINGNSIQVLNEYMAFRHFIRHSYSFQLKWSQLKELSDPKCV